MSGRSPTRLVQLQHGAMRRVGRVEEPDLRILSGPDSVYGLACAAVAEGRTLPAVVERHATPETLSYDDVYSGRSPWRLLVPIDHPEPARCLVSGTGLTHLGSAASRNAMHDKGDDQLTDSMRMFRAGLEGGRPAPGTIGTPPEWFYKGSGAVLRACHDTLTVPPFAEDGGEEGEVAGVYLIDADGRPCRIGMAAGNEFSDHVFEKRNYLNLAGSKLRMCALGPELVIDPDFESVAGHVAIERDGRPIWEKDIATGETQMCHSLGNIEYHHFKFDAHRRPGDVHVHYFGAHSLSFTESVCLRSGDVMTIQFAGFGRPLRNPVTVAAGPETPIVVQSLASA